MLGKSILFYNIIWVIIIHSSVVLNVDTYQTEMFSVYKCYDYAVIH